jgi:hypothetical protein
MVLAQARGEQRKVDLPMTTQFLPPSDAYRYEPPHFDNFQFEGKHRRGRAVDSLAHSDFLNSFHIMRRKQTRKRRKQTPEWATNDVLLREVLVQFMERRAFLNKPQAGTLKERLDRAEQTVAAQAPKLRSQLERFIHEYRELTKVSKCKWQPTGRMLELELEIQNTDRQLRIIRRGVAATLAAIVYMYFRLGFDSVTIAEQLDLTSTHIHQTIYKLSKLAERQSNKKGQNPKAPVLTRPNGAGGSTVGF